MRYALGGALRNKDENDIAHHLREILRRKRLIELELSQMVATTTKRRANGN